MPNGVEFDGRLAHVGTFPIGIEPGSFIEVNALTCSAISHVNGFDPPILTAEFEKGVRAGTYFEPRTSV
jgi:hypothetical protein